MHTYQSMRYLSMRCLSAKYLSSIFYYDGPVTRDSASLCITQISCQFVYPDTSRGTWHLYRSCSYALDGRLARLIRASQLSVAHSMVVLSVKKVHCRPREGFTRTNMHIFHR